MSQPDREHPTSYLTHAEVEVPASPEQVWQAIASGEGNAAWLFPAEIEPREGGAIRIHREPFGDDATARVTSWDPPHRFGYEELLTAADGSGTRPLATEFLVEARDGGTCVVRVVSGLHLDSEGWEDLLDGVGEGWRMSLPLLRSYLRHFAGQPATGRIDVLAGAGRPLAAPGPAAATVMRRLGLAGRASGDEFRVADGPLRLAGSVEYRTSTFAVLRATEPGPALYAISVFPMDGITPSVNVCGRFFGADGAATAARERPRWDAWLANHC